MRPEGVIALVLGHAALAAGGLALLAVLQCALPELGRRAGVEAALRPGRSLLVGAGAWLAWLGLASLADRAGAPAAGALIGVGGMGLLALGSLGAALALGERLAAEAGRGLPPLTRLALGWAALAFLVYVPFLGWCAMLAALVMGSGAGLRALVRSGGEERGVGVEGLL